MDAPIRGGALLRAGVGAALTVFPGRLASAAEGCPATPCTRLFTRVLGVRHLTQAALTLTAPQLLTPWRGAFVDGLHMATVMVLAAGSPRHRRAALVNAALAAMFCGLGIVLGHAQRVGEAGARHGGASHAPAVRRSDERPGDALPR
ncbi:MAG: hypothetical protein JO281_03385 [Pseudonocardiales bacterium]|nr:hypothetical protein [Pseudonocardiales bacterium]